MAEDVSPVIKARGIAACSQSEYWLENAGMADENMTLPGAYLPSMAEIMATPDNGFRLVSTFSGCGGSCLGFRWAGFRTLWASEFIPAAREVYQVNFPGVPVDARDIREVTVKDVLDATGLRVGEVDVLEGSPPCASFSTAGKREAGWGKVKPYSDTKQRTDDLFYEFIRLLEGLQPKVFVAENVKGLVTGVAKGYFKEIHGGMTQAGYRVSCRVLDAQYFGVPQHRERAIFVGVRKDLEAAPSHPKPQTRPVPLREVLPWIVSTDHWGQFENAGHKEEHPSTKPGRTVFGTSGGAQHFTVTSETDISRYAIGEDEQLSPLYQKYWEAAKPGGKVGKFESAVKVHPDRPSPTVIQAEGNGGIYPPHEKRKFTIAELKRICAFPDDFILLGTYAQQWECLGRAVPPLLMKAIAEHVRDNLLNPVTTHD